MLGNVVDFEHGKKKRQPEKLPLFFLFSPMVSSKYKKMCKTAIIRFYTSYVTVYHI